MEAKNKDQVVKPLVYAFRITRKDSNNLNVAKGLFHAQKKLKLFYSTEGDIFKEKTFGVSSMGNRVYFFEDIPRCQAPDPQTLGACLKMVGWCGGEIPRNLGADKDEVYDLVEIYPFVHPVPEKVFDSLVKMYHSKNYFITQERKGEYVKTRISQTKKQNLLESILRGIEVGDFSERRFPPPKDKGYFMWW